MTNELDITRNLVLLTERQTLVESQHSILEVSPNVLNPLLISRATSPRPNVDTVESFSSGDDYSSDLVREGWRERGRGGRGIGGGVGRRRGVRIRGFESFSYRCQHLFMRLYPSEIVRV